MSWTCFFVAVLNILPGGYGLHQHTEQDTVMKLNWYVVAIKMKANARDGLAPTV